MEFLRNTLVPTGKRDIYPERRKTDSGEVIVDDDGIERRVTLSYKTRGGDVPMCISGMDPELYRGIYALSSKDLEDGKAVSSDEISRRYLTVPGGSGMPKAMESVSDMVDQKVGKVSKSPSEVNRIEGELAGLRMTIAEQRMRAGTYGDIVAEEESLRGSWPRSAPGRRRIPRGTAATSC